MFDLRYPMEPRKGLTQLRRAYLAALSGPVLLILTPVQGLPELSLLDEAQAVRVSLLLSGQTTLMGSALGLALYTLARLLRVLLRTGWDRPVPPEARTLTVPGVLAALWAFLMAGLAVASWYRLLWQPVPVPVLVPVLPLVLALLALAASVSALWTLRLVLPEHWTPDLLALARRQARRREGGWRRRHPSRPIDRVQ